MTDYADVPAVIVAELRAVCLALPKKLVAQVDRPPDDGDGTG